MPAGQKVTRKLKAILSADVKGYSLLMTADEVLTVRTLKSYRKLMSAQIEQNKGRVVDAPGDNLLAEFDSAVDAVQCAVQIQRIIKSKNNDLPSEKRLVFRIGVNIGDVIQDEDRLYGEGVNIAARIEGLAESGGVCISRNTYDQVSNKLSFGYEYLGEHSVKNIIKPVRVYKILMNPEDAGKLIGEEKKQVKKIWILPTVVLAAIMIVSIAWQVYQKISKPEFEPASTENMAFPLPDKPSIAVLPLTNMSGDPEQEYFCEGMTDQIITSLSMIPRLFVIARNSTFAYKGKAIKIKKVAEELGVRYVLEGSVQKSVKRIRILVQLIDATSGHHLWSERYDRDLKDLFSLQDEISKKIMTNLQVELTEGDYARLVAGGTSKLKAIECFWRGSKHFFRFSKEDNALARQWGEKSIESDANFADAWALLGWSHLIDGSYSWSKSQDQSLKRAEECAQTAIALNNSNSKAYSLLGRIRSNQRKYDEAIEYGEKSVALSPNDPIMITTLAVTMHFTGRFDESIALIKKAMRLSPYYPALYLRLLSRSYLLTGRYEEAKATSKMLLDRSLNGEFNPLFAHIQLAEACIGFGRVDEARAHAEEVLKIDPNFSLNGFRILRYYRNPVHSERRIAALRKAGLP